MPDVPPILTDKQLLDFLDRAKDDDSVSSFQGVLDKLHDAVFDDSNASVREALNIVALEEEFAPADEPAEPAAAESLAFLAADHGRLQWAFLLVDDGRAKDLGEALQIMRAKS